VIGDWNVTGRRARVTFQSPITLTSNHPDLSPTAPACIMAPMSQELWKSVDEYFETMLLPNDPVLDAAVKASVDAHLPPIAVSAVQGKLLHLLARSIQANKILEIGTLGAYSTIWLGRALPAGGKLITLELDAKHAAVARSNLARAGLADKVELMLGRALDTLPKLASSGTAPFDLIFIDADKPSNPEYFTWAMKLSRPGSVIIVDNVVRKGAVIDAKSADEDVRGVRRCLELMNKEPRFSATVLQSVGTKGYDGLVMGVVD
jgi:predicted O-methyltransferase YrrM